MAITDPVQPKSNFSGLDADVRIRDLRGLGPKSEEQLERVGISTPEDLRAIGVQLLEKTGSASSRSWRGIKNCGD